MTKDNQFTLKKLLPNYQVLLEQIETDDSKWRKQLFQEADKSNFSVVDWLDSLNVLYNWLDEKGLNLSFRNGLNYVSCAAESVSNSSTLNHLPSLVHDFLDQYGCDLAVKK